MKALAIIFGVLLLLPGLCFLGFGLIFTFGGGGMQGLGFIELVIGGLTMWAAIALFNAGS